MIAPRIAGPSYGTYPEVYAEDDLWCDACGSDSSGTSSEYVIRLRDRELDVCGNCLVELAAVLTKAAKAVRA